MVLLWDFKACMYRQILQQERNEIKLHCTHTAQCSVMSPSRPLICNSSFLAQCYSVLVDNISNAFGLSRLQRHRLVAILSVLWFRDGFRHSSGPPDIFVLISSKQNNCCGDLNKLSVMLSSTPVMLRRIPAPNPTASQIKNPYPHC